MSDFYLHWGKVPSTCANAPHRANCQLIALWPAPVNADACFAEAGFTDFGDADAAWEQEAATLLLRVMQALESEGPAQLASLPKPLARPWYKIFFSKPEKSLTLLERLDLAMTWDSLPRCKVLFGERGASLRVGDGHILYWINLPEAGKSPEEFVSEIAGNWPVYVSPLRWESLLREHHHAE
jgi:hypothetical protein